MLRHLSAVILAASLGSLLATLLWVALEGGTGAPSPVRFVIGFALFTMFFTFPGAMLLMYLSLKCADRGLTVREASLLLLAGGTVAGAAMLAFFAPNIMTAGALYGSATEAMFIAAKNLRLEGASGPRSMMSAMGRKRTLRRRLTERPLPSLSREDRTVS